MKVDKEDIREAFETLEDEMERDVDSRLIDYSEQYRDDTEPEKPRARFYPVWDKEARREMVRDRETGEIMCLAVVCAMLQFETELRELAEARAAKPRPRTTRTIVDLRQRRRRAA